MSETYSWAPFYNTFARKLLEFKDRRPELIDRLQRALTSIEMPVTFFEQDGGINDIDPFTIFGFFNKKQRWENRTRILGAFAKELGIHEEIPTTFDGIPVLNNQNANFVPYRSQRSEEDVDMLWELFAIALKYSDDPSDQNKEDMSRFFDYCVRMKRNGIGKITMVLFWIAPGTFLNTDSRNMWYIYQSGKIPHGIVDTLPTIETKSTATKYFDLVEKMDAFIASEESSFSNLIELSAEAWRYSEEVNVQQREERARQEEARDFFEWWPAEDEYHPGLSKNDWLDLLDDEVVFTPSAIDIVMRMLDNGGQGSCKELSEKYGESPNYYNGGSQGLAKRVQRKTNCPTVPDAINQDAKWWPILYVGKHAGNDDAGAFIWKLRPELEEALRDQNLLDTYLRRDLRAEFEKWLKKQEKHDGAGPYSSRTIKNYSRSLQREAGQIDADYDFRDNLFTYIDAESFDVVRNIIEGAKNYAEVNGRNHYTLSAAMEQYAKFLGSRTSSGIAERHAHEPYSKQDFLREVFISEQDYNTLVSLLRKKKNIILQGAPGVGKTFAAKRLAYSILGEKDDSKVKVIQFHQNYTYEDFIMGYKPLDSGGFELKEGIFYRFCINAVKNPDSDYFLIIDEINRGNLSKILGELLMLIETDYRDEELDLAYTGERFSIPKNLNIIGMMNTADRSLALIDYALRRRFSFFEMQPGFDSEGFLTHQESLASEKLSTLLRAVQDLNKEIADDASLGKGFLIGHSYFCGLTPGSSSDSDLEEIVKYDLVPIIEEYWFDDPEKTRTWSDRLLGTLNE